jgi:DNA-binding response OmpR family regulator
MHCTQSTEMGQRFFLAERGTNSNRAPRNRKAPLVSVVDDDLSVREAVGSLLRSAGFRVETFASAQEFFASLHAELPSCLVLDVQLPGLSGLDLQRQLAEAGVRIPIIFLSGHGDVAMSVRAINAGAHYFLTKPFHDEDLLDAIQCCICRDDGNNLPPKKNSSESLPISIRDGRGTRAMNSDRPNPVLLLSKLATAI